MARLRHIDWRAWLPGPTLRIVTQVEAADEIPVTIPKNGAVLVGSREQPKWLALDCPCGTGHRVMVTLEPTHWPHWTLEGRDADNRITLWPSIDCQTEKRRCHYFIRRGRVHWIRERSWFHGWA
jgi:hypothetical protein